MKVQVHGWVQDNAGTYHPAGVILTIDADGGDKCISAKRTDALVKMGAATRLAAPEKAPKA